jgi:hypothetical protein
VHAARALHFITASEPWEDTEIVAVTPDDELTVVEREARLAGDTEAGVIRERFRRFTTDVSRWREASEAHSRRFAREARARFGMPLSSANQRALAAPFIGTR